MIGVDTLYGVAADDRQISHHCRVVDLAAAGETLCCDGRAAEHILSPSNRWPAPCARFYSINLQPRMGYSHRIRTSFSAACCDPGPPGRKPWAEKPTGAANIRHERSGEDQLGGVLRIRSGVWGMRIIEEGQVGPLREAYKKEMR